MEDKKRLIDANALISKAQRMETTDNNGIPVDIKAVSLLAIEDAPTVDAVEVVRCKDCKHGMKSHLQPRHAKNYLCRHSWEGEYHEPNHFCSYGERRTDA